MEPREVQLWQYYCPSLESHKLRNVPPFWHPPGGQLLGAVAYSLLGGCSLDLVPASAGPLAAGSGADHPFCSEYCGFSLGPGVC